MLHGKSKLIFSERKFSLLSDFIILLSTIAVIYGVITAISPWFGPVEEKAEISLSPEVLPIYAGYSLLRMAIAYLLSFLFAIVYGYIAAYYARAERVMLPILDILQSIPVLSFLPGVMLAMVALFPTKQVGVELGSILLIFTGQVWNMAFSFYSSLKSIPKELREVTEVYNFSRWLRFRYLELPYSTIGLVWNSMMSVAGGWFFLMACEMFTLGEKDFRLLGLGSYLQKAADEGDVTAILWGLGTMITVIVILDLLLWRPLIAWSDKFKLEQVESEIKPRSKILNLIRRSSIIDRVSKNLLHPLNEKITLLLSRRNSADRKKPSLIRKRIVENLYFALALAFVVYGLWLTIRLFSGLSSDEILMLIQGALATFLRVLAALLIGLAWTVPVGVWIGLRPKVARFAQPIVQVVASIPATALFPVVLLFLIHWGGGLSIGAIALMLLGTQWYILFNVIAGAMSIPNDLREASAVFKFSFINRWRLLILPAIFPYLVTGMVTAVGGAWNASIVAEYFSFKNETLSTIGLGAIINRSSSEGNMELLFASTLVMASVVVLINRTVWRRLYKLASTKFKMES